MQQAGTPGKTPATVKPDVAFEAFRYPACTGAPGRPAWNGWAEANGDAVDSPDSNQEDSLDDGAAGEAFVTRLADETKHAFDTGLAQGRQEGRNAEREAHAAAALEQTEQRKRQLAQLVASFTSERDKFLHAVELEVVKLALAIAARILRREAQMDPLLLTGAVRVALGQLAGATEIHLRVPPHDLNLWTEAVAHLPKLAIKPAIAAGEGMQLGDCVIESRVGTVDLGLRSQLAEIERGFFDRPAAMEGEIVAPQISALESQSS
jgi:flagellar assembly protein FliH